MSRNISWYDSNGNIKFCQVCAEGLEDASCPEEGLGWVEGHPELINNSKVIDGEIINGNTNSELLILDEIRIIRENRLNKSDWTQTEDSPLSDAKKAEWATYRQLLRDLPSQYTDSDNINDVVFPTQPD